MSLIYTLVAREQIVLCEHAEASGNFATITHVILRKITTTNKMPGNRCTFEYDSHRFHFLLDDGLTYLLMADMDVRTTVAFALLNDVKDRFQARYEGRAQTAIAFAMNEFSRDLKFLMEKYKNQDVPDQYDGVKKQLDSVKDVMVQNIEKVLERGEKIDLLVDKTAHLQQQAFKFEHAAKKLKNVMWWKSAKMTMVVALLGLLLVWLIASVICGFTLQRCISSGSSSNANPSPTPQP